MKIAVIGSGISGLGAALALSKDHEVMLLEKNDRFGGHAHTIDIQFGEVTISTDTAFMVFNTDSYPNLSALFNYLGIESERSKMSFSVSLNDGEFEFSSSSPFADRSNMFSVDFFKFLLEIPRFNSLAKKTLSEGVERDITIGEFLDVHGFSQGFRYGYLYPVASLIWSAPPRLVSLFPLGMVLTFLDNHQLLQIRPGREWRSVKGGSREYVKRVIEYIREHGGSAFCNVDVSSIKRARDHVIVESSRGKERFDIVIFATHADTTLNLIETPSEEEESILGAFRYDPSRVVVHSDPSFMPKRKRAWASWNFCDTKLGHEEEEASLTYDMNVLNGIPEKYPVFATINPVRAVKNELVHSDLIYSHPIYSVATQKAQKHLHELQGQNNSYFCGAYFGYGFHEDGLESGLAVAQMLGSIPPWQKN